MRGRRRLVDDGGVSVVSVYGVREMQAEGKKVTKERWHRVEGLHRGVIGGEERSRGGEG